jgi:hypothetical protein
MGMNLYVHTRTMKIVPLRRTSTSGPRRGTAGRVFFIVINPPRGRPVGGGGNHRTRFPASYVHNSIFIGNTQLHSQRSIEISSPPLWLPRMR